MQDQNRQTHNVETLKPADAARKLNIGKSKMYELLDSGEFPSIRLGKRCIRIPAAALAAWMAAATTQSGDAR